MNNRDKVNILHNSLFIFVSKFIDTFGGILIVIVLARFLNPEGFGLYAFIISIFLAIQPIINLELDKILIRELSTIADKERFLQSTISLKAIILFFYFIIFLPVIFFSGGEPYFKAGMVICLFAEIFIQYNLISVSVLIAFKKAFYDSISNTLSKCFFLGWVLTAWMLKEDIVFIFWGYLISNIIRFIILTFSVHTYILKVKFIWNNLYIKYLISQCLPIAIASFIIGLTFRIDIFIIRLFLGDADVGLFYGIHKIILVIQIVPVSIINSFFPHFSLIAKQDRDQYTTLFKKSFECLFLIASAIMAFNLMFFREIILILYGESYQGAGFGFLLLIPVSLFLFLDYLNTISLTALNRQKMLIYSGLSAFIVNLALDIILVPRLGMEGACIGTFFSYLVLFGVSFFCHPMSIIKKVQFIKNIFNFMVLGVIMLISYSIPDSGILFKISIIVFYYSLLYFLYNLPDKFRQIINIYRERQ